ncbi:MAG: hypothetical protein JHC90_02365 [Ilumatobacteraceae bacterium]|nr:hypothetical protein [Ilumatobacteraceae bacterium]
MKHAAIALIEILSFNIAKIIVKGMTPKDLQRGPGHFPKTPMPGEMGNCPSDFSQIDTQPNFTSRFLTSRIKYCNVCTTQHSVSCDAFLFLPIHQLAFACWGVNH